MEKINVAELLKDCPKGMELDCTMIDNVVFEKLDFISSHHPIIIRRTDSNKTIHLTKYGQYSDEEDYKCVIFPKGKTTWEGFVPPCQFKDGDILVRTQNQRFIMSIYHKRITELIIKTHCILWDKDEGLSINMDICCYPDNTRLATEEEKAKLFQAIKDNGYKWNEETKTLEKLIVPKFKVGDRIRRKNGNEEYIIISINDCTYYYRLNEHCTGSLGIQLQDEYELVPPKFDISTLESFDKVLVRDNNAQEWRISLFSHDNGLEYFKYSCLNGIGYAQCIPYEANKHLRGKIDDCDEFYKNWE